VQLVILEVLFYPRVNVLRITFVEWLRNSIYEAVSPRPLAGFRIAFAILTLIEFFHFVHRRDLVFLEFPLQQTIPNEVVTSLDVVFRNSRSTHWFFDSASGRY
jgi:hypothetical protein